jgi:hypothetical protein
LNLGACDGGVLRIDHFDFDFRGSDCQKDNQQKKDTSEYTRKAHARLLYHAKGLCGWFTPVSWLASQDVSFRPASATTTGLPRLSFSGFPSDQLRFPRLQLRGSAGFAPASHSASVSPAYDHARTQF